MVKRTQLGEIMETACTHCGSRFRLTEIQLRKAYGKVRCGQCGSLFNALRGLKNFEGELPPGYLERLREASAEAEASKGGAAAEQRRELSLQEAMYGPGGRSAFSIGPLGWFIGILLLGAVGIAQAVYYQRYQLIEDPRYQQQVVNLCRILPCAESEFASTEQIRMLERNVFTHPIANNALMVTGSFKNQAPFRQKLPDMLISLFDVQGKLIANRLFTPTEYLLEDRNRRAFDPGATVQFRLEIVDPGTDALTYEFEFY
ncbi:MAG: zinc-ribbon and DUF3426 domain-containing protein [Gammaproteobacteria bacterium]|jgi:predicted Zn finger-like uncharacterized protein